MSHVPYASAVGSLMYVMVCTRLDIAHVVGVLSSFMSNLGKEHWTIVKRVSDICVALVIMVYDTMVDQDWTEFWTSVVLLMQAGLEIWTK